MTTQEQDKKMPDRDPDPGNLLFLRRKKNKSFFECFTSRMIL